MTVETLNFKNVIKTTLASEKGYLDQERKDLDSIKTSDETLDAFPSKIDKKTIFSFESIFDPLHYNKHTISNKACIYLIVRFPHESPRGNTYIFVLCDYDTNVIGLQHDLLDQQLNLQYSQY